MLTLTFISTKTKNEIVTDTLINNMIVTNNKFLSISNQKENQP